MTLVANSITLTPGTLTVEVQDEPPVLYVHCLGLDDPDQVRRDVLDLQRDALLKAGCEKIFEEKKSGKAGTKRPAFEVALAFLRLEDVLVVWKLDRLGRSLAHLVNTVKELSDRKIGLRVLTGKGAQRHCCKVSDEAAFCLIQRPYISKTLLTRRISPRGSP